MQQQQVIARKHYGSLGATEYEEKYSRSKERNDQTTKPINDQHTSTIIQEIDINSKLNKNRNQSPNNKAPTSSTQKLQSSSSTKSINQKLHTLQGIEEVRLEIKEIEKTAIASKAQAKILKDLQKKLILLLKSLKWGHSDTVSLINYLEKNGCKHLLQKYLQQIEYYQMATFKKENLDKIMLNRNSQPKINKNYQKDCWQCEFNIKLSHKNKNVNKFVTLTEKQWLAATQLTRPTSLDSLNTKPVLIKNKQPEIAQQIDTELQKAIQIDTFVEQYRQKHGLFFDKSQNEGITVETIHHHPFDAHGNFSRRSSVQAYKTKYPASKQFARAKSPEPSRLQRREAKIRHNFDFQKEVIKDNALSRVDAALDLRSDRRLRQMITTMQKIESYRKQHKLYI